MVRPTPIASSCGLPASGNLQALGAMLEGQVIADSIAIMGSMDFVLGDVDR